MTMDLKAMARECVEKIHGISEGPEYVTCESCFRPKSPIGRDVASAVASEFCHSTKCEGYYESPKPSSLFPGEEHPLVRIILSYMEKVVEECAAKADGGIPYEDRKVSGPQGGGGMLPGVSDHIAKEIRALIPKKGEE